VLDHPRVVASYLATDAAAIDERAQVGPQGVGVDHLDVVELGKPADGEGLAVGLADPVELKLPFDLALLDL
jgi:hypothetical protein